MRDLLRSESDKRHIRADHIFLPTFALIRIEEIAVKVSVVAAFAVQVDADFSALPLNPPVRAIINGKILRVDLGVEIVWHSFWSCSVGRAASAL